MALVLRFSCNFVALTLCLFVLESFSLQAHAANRGSFGRKNVKDKTPTQGLCTSSVTIHGYKCQELEVTTGDGYILGVQRTPEGRAEVNGSETKKQPVIVQHGVMVDGMTWFMNSPEQNLPMILADNGFDVWIVNSRGTRYSRKHTSLDASNPAYWNWSWDEMVTYDMPAVFDYVSKQTGQKIDYVGHSMGTLVALASFSEGKLVNQLKSATLLSPITYLSHMKTKVVVLAAKSFLGEMLSNQGMKEFDPKGSAVTKLMKNLVCSKPGVECGDTLSAITGKNCCFDPLTLDLFSKNEPQPSSTKNMIHLSQMIRNGGVTKFKNEGASPPIYNLSNIPHDLPLFLSYGSEDALADVDDVKALLEDLKPHDADKLRVQFIKEYAHGDYFMGNNAKDLVYKDVTSFFKLQF